MQFRETGTKGGRGSEPTAAEDQDHLLVVQPVPDKREDVQGAAIEPVGVVNGGQQRAVLRSPRQEAQGRRRGDEPVRAGRFLFVAQDPQKRVTLQTGQVVHVAGEWPQQLMQASELEVRFRLCQRSRN
jgi:hypothetical protein